jgi:hypothetical protein
MKLNVNDKIQSTDGSMTLQVTNVRDTGYDVIIIMPLTPVASEDIGDPFFDQGWIVVQ